LPNFTFEINDCHLYVKHHHYHSITQQQESVTACPAGKYVLKCLLSPDVRQLATASADKTVKLWNLDGFTLERTLTGMLACLHMQITKTGLALCICILEFSTMIRLSHAKSYQMCHGVVWAYNTWHSPTSRHSSYVLPLVHCYCCQHVGSLVFQQRL